MVQRETAEFSDLWAREVARRSAPPRRLPATPFILFALGGLANAAVVVANGCMPVAELVDGLVPTLARHCALTSTTRLAPLADVWPVLGGWASVGDALILVGVVLVAAWMRWHSAQKGWGSAR